jgi:peptidoglycan/xylan/chitin deacetylase (PgdA/CDA1 family)
MKKTVLFLAAGTGILLIIFVSTFQYSRSWKHALFIEPIYDIRTGEKVVALTFDDGPSEARTPALLELLDQYNTEATFFMLGQNMEKYPEIARAVFDHGHLIGNHSYDHPRMILKSRKFMKNQIIRTDSLIRLTGQKEVVYFRPPGTSKNILLPLVLKSMGKKLVTGTYDPPSEYAAAYNAEKVATEVIANAVPGSIIYLHDGKNTGKEEFIESVELIIVGLKDQGYSFVTVDHGQDQEKGE